MNTNEKKLENIKKTLVELYSQLPDQFALQDVKTYFKKTINSINEAQSKRNRRDAQQQQNATQNVMQFSSLESAQKALEILDKMLEEEQKNIDKTQKQQQQSNPDSLLNG